MLVPMTERRAPTVTPTSMPTDEDRIAPIADWLARTIAPLMEANEPVQVVLDIKGADVKVRWTQSARVT